LGGAAATSLLGCTRPTRTAQPAAPLQLANSESVCVVRPRQAEGPYFTDTQLNRRDIRSDPTTGLVSSGIPLQLTIHIFQRHQESCQPLRGAVVDVWHCDASGIYSNVSDRAANTVGQKFLRGFQVTDDNGRVEFLTIYPGWYPGRTTHIHFKIRGSVPQSYEFTSQLYFNDAITDQVQAIAPYRNRTAVRIRNAQDGLFSRGGNQLIVPTTATSEGYSSNFDIGLELNALSVS